MLQRQFDTHEIACRNLLEDKLVLPAYEQMVKASHSFNLLDARHAVSVTERQRFILRVRTLARGVAEAYRASREALGFPLLKNVAGAASGLMKARDLLFELRHGGAAAANPPDSVDRADRGHGQRLGCRRHCARQGPGLRDAAPARGVLRSCAERAPDRQVERRGPPLRNAFDAGGRPTQAASAFAKNCGVPVASSSGWRPTRARGWCSAAPSAAHRREPAWRHHQSGHRRAAHRQAHALGGAHRGVRATGAQRGAAVWREVVPVEVLGLSRAESTVGHRFHAPRPISLKSAKSYESRLRSAKVVADFSVRRELIRAGVMAAAAAAPAARR